MWICLVLLKIRCTVKVTNEEVLGRMDRDHELLMITKPRKTYYLGHIMGNTKYQSLSLRFNLKENLMAGGE